MALLGDMEAGASMSHVGSSGKGFPGRAVIAKVLGKQAWWTQNLKDQDGQPTVRRGRVAW